MLDEKLTGQIGLMLWDVKNKYKYLLMLKLQNHASQFAALWIICRILPFWNFIGHWHRSSSIDQVKQIFIYFFFFLFFPFKCLNACHFKSRIFTCQKWRKKFFFHSLAVPTICLGGSFSSKCYPFDFMKSIYLSQTLRCTVPNAYSAGLLSIH